MSGFYKSSRKPDARNFPRQMIHSIIDDVETEVVDRMYEQWREETEPGHESLEPTSWEEAAEDLDGFPELKDNHDMEMEMSKKPLLGLSPWRVFLSPSPHRILAA